MYSLPDIQGISTEEKVQSLIEYIYQLVEQLNNTSTDVIMICSEIERILSIDETSLVGNTNAKSILEQKNKLKSIIQNIRG